MEVFMSHTEDLVQLVHELRIAMTEARVMLAEADKRERWQREQERGERPRWPSQEPKELLKESKEPKELLLYQVMGDKVWRMNELIKHGVANGLAESTMKRHLASGLAKGEVIRWERGSIVEIGVASQPATQARIVAEQREMDRWLLKAWRAGIPDELPANAVENPILSYGEFKHELYQPRMEELVHEGYVDWIGVDQVFRITPKGRDYRAELEA
jgi:hypothetical protein